MSRHLDLDNPTPEQRLVVELYEQACKELDGCKHENQLLRKRFQIALDDRAALVASDDALRARVGELEIQVDAYEDASTPAFDEIAALCGCPEREYPGQVVRDVRMVVDERDQLRATVAELEKERDDWKACAARTGTERRSDEMQAVHERDALRAENSRLKERG